MSKFIAGLFLSVALFLTPVTATMAQEADACYTPEENFIDLTSDPAVKGAVTITDEAQLAAIAEVIKVEYDMTEVLVFGRLDFFDVDNNLFGDGVWVTITDTNGCVVNAFMDTLEHVNKLLAAAGLPSME